MTNETETASFYIQRLDEMSKTPQHELVVEMLDHYGVSGTINLNAEQIKQFYFLKLREEGHDHG